MKHLYLAVLFLICISGATLNAQNLIQNGSFEDATSPWTSWSSTVANGNLWAGLGSCTASEGTDYCWSGDQGEATGINNLNEDMYQTITIPPNTIACTLTFDASINTLENTSTQVYDEMEIVLQTAGGSFLTSLGYLSNLQGDNGLSSCQAWSGYFAVIPSQYFGQTIRVLFQFTTDFSAPTIFRLDDINVTPELPCNYSLSTTNYTLNSAVAGNFSSVSSVNTTTGCTWNAQVTSGSSWLSTTSSGNGNGDINISVTANPSINMRTGTINVQGEVLTVNQPGKICEYSLGIGTYYCPDHEGDDYNNITIVTADDDCTWDAEVVLGSEWLICNSNGTGDGVIDISVVENNTMSDRTGQIVVEGETLLVIQPVDFNLTGLREYTSDYLTLYPNPAENELHFKMGDDFGAATYEIYTQLGAVLLQGEVMEMHQQIDISSLPSGSYFFQVRTTESTETLHFIKS